MLITLSNDFHNTSIRVIPHESDGGNLYLSVHQLRRARRALCGMDDCKCSDWTGIREKPVDEKGNKYHLVLISLSHDWPNGAFLEKIEIETLKTFY